MNQGAMNVPRPPFHAEQKALLEKHFGFASLHPEQQVAVDAILNGRDCSVTAPTGFGKSLCFALPALVSYSIDDCQGRTSVPRNGGRALTVVVSPLLALIADQIVGLQRKKIPCAMISSSQTQKQNSDVLSALTGAGALPFALLYVTAERLTSASFLNTLAHMHKKGRLAFFAIDEAHTISQWGMSCCCLCFAAYGLFPVVLVFVRCILNAHCFLTFPHLVRVPTCAQGTVSDQAMLSSVSFVAPSRAFRSWL